MKLLRADQFKKILILGAFLLFSITSADSLAQNYSITPGKNPNCFSTCNSFGEFRVDFNNLLSEKMHLTFVTVSNTLPTCWQSTLCILGPCFEVIPPSGPMDSVPVGGSGFLKLNIVFPDSGVSGKIVFYVYETAFPTTGDTITFLVEPSECDYNCDGSVISGTQERYSEHTFGLRNTLVENVLCIENQTDSDIGYVISDVFGRDIYKGLSKSREAILNHEISDLKNGIYFIRFTNSNRERVQKFVKI